MSRLKKPREKKNQKNEKIKEKKQNKRKRWGCMHVWFSLFKSWSELSSISAACRDLNTYWYCWWLLVVEGCGSCNQSIACFDETLELRIDLKCPVSWVIYVSHAVKAFNRLCRYGTRTHDFQFLSTLKANTTIINMNFPTKSHFFMNNNEFLSL